MAAEGPGAVPGIEGTARLVGAYVWLEERLYLLLGKWAAESAPSADPTAQSDAVYFDTVSQHHAGHARLLAEHIPVVGGAEGAGLVSSPGEVAERLLGALEGLAPAARRSAMVEVVHPWLAERFRYHLTQIDEVSDGPLRRALELVGFDLGRDRLAAVAGPTDAQKEVAPLEALRQDQAAELFPWMGP